MRQFNCVDVLNAFCYTGGFTLAALASGARRVTSVDSSAPALQRLRDTCG
ncbi:MAG: class I SAM-dependent methyltransferase [Burkholderiaceae bacterium]|nr:class I SAM-dependent methyltransferase [Burkholderiaceae bacterium]